jgi:dihydropteroate synthase
MVTIHIASSKHARHETLRHVLEKPFAIMGIVNVTPDSFYDGGKFFAVDRALDHACRLAGQGADVLDIGGQSTRPGSKAVDAEEQCRRILPVIEAVAKKVAVPMSVDTTSSVVAERALSAGACWINDISAGRFDPNMPFLVAKKQCPVILMHSRKAPETMQLDPLYADVVAEVKMELADRADVFLKAGTSGENIILDPGIGFAKRKEDNLVLLARIKELVMVGYSVCVGTSRKSFIGHSTGAQPGKRLPGSLAGIVPAFEAGVRLFRVHDVEETVQFLQVLHAVKMKN